MHLMLFRHLWGVDGAWEDVFPKIRDAGYAGIEAVLPEPQDRERFRALLDRHGFEYIPQIFTGGDSIEAHVDSFRRQVQAGAEMGARQINCHSGRDGWSEAQAVDFYERALEIERAIGLPVAHETHRGRVLYNPWVTSRLIERLDDLKLCCDFSHWVCVCERLLDGELEIVRRCAERCIHIHARVGYEEGPQVPDPRAPEYQRHLEAHEAWWRLIWDAQAARGETISTLTPEFGPPLYLHTLPHTQQPVADLWEVCEWQARREEESFARWREGR